MIQGRNLLIVLAHGLRGDAISDERAWPLATPKIRMLGRRGVRLTTTAASTADPVAMTSLLSGLHPRQHGCLVGGQPVTLQAPFTASLREAGYHVAGVGCVGAFRESLDEAIHVADPEQIAPTDCAYFDHLHQRSFAMAVSRQREQCRLKGPFEPERLLMDTEDDIDGFITRRAVEAAARMPGNRPWALVVVYSGPANELPPPTLYEELVPAVNLHDGFTTPDFCGMDALCEPVYPRAHLQRLTPHTLGMIRSDYLGRVSLIDQGVGSLQRMIANREDVDRTWTVLASDRGHLLGEHGLLGARSFLRGALRTPLIVAPPPTRNWPRPDPPQGMYHTVDVAATIAALGRCDAPIGCVGRSVLPLLSNDVVRPEHAGGNLSEFSERVLLETEHHKAVFNRTNGEAIALHDLMTDVDEASNLAETPEGQNQLDAFRSRLGLALLPLRAVAGAARGKCSHVTPSREPSA